VYNIATAYYYKHVAGGLPANVAKYNNQADTESYYCIWQVGRLILAGAAIGLILQRRLYAFTMTPS